MSEADELYETTNLYPAETGLPMTVWVSPRGRAQHDVRQLVPADQQAVSRWVSLNEDALIAYWNGQIGTIELARRLQPLSPASAP